jgi:AcrR family transcriptional regulator
MTTGARLSGPKGQSRRDEILEVARRVLVGDGWDRFVVREIAAGVGITLGHLQYYFATRDDLLEAVVRAEFARNQAEIRAIAGGPGAPADRLASIARHLLRVWGRDGGRVYAVMSLLAMHHPRFRALHRAVYRAFYQALVPTLAALRPDASGAELLATARLVTTIVDGALVQLPGRRFVDDAVAAVVGLAKS